MAEEDQSRPVTVIVDGANVMGSRAGGWWRDPPAAMARLHGELEALAAHGVPGAPPGDDPWSAPGDDPGLVPGPGRPAGDDAGRPDGGSTGAGRWFPRIVLVVEGKARGAADLVAPERGVRLVVARGAGDDEIARLAGSTPGRRIVVTADRELRRRCQNAGAGVAGPRWLTRLLG